MAIGQAKRRRLLRPMRWYFWISAVLLVGAMLAIFNPGIRNGPPRARTRCNNNLKNIALAIRNYETANGCLPPAYIADENGKPMHSWRVLILPYLDNGALYRQYRFDEPWDGPNNRKLHDVALQVFGCPEDDERGSTDTSYCVVIGPRTAFPGTESVTSDVIDQKDGLSNVIMVVEVHNSGIHWMEPRDLQLSQIPMKLNPAGRLGVSSSHGDVVNVAFADGRAVSIPEKIPAADLRQLLTIDDGSPAELP